MYYLYIIYSGSKNKFYVGQTSNLEERIQRHNKKRVLSTMYGIPWMLIHCEEYNTRQEAAKREQHLKSPAGWSDLKIIKETYRNVAQPG